MHRFTNVPHTLPILLNCNNDIIMVDSMANIHGHSRIAVSGDIKLAMHIGWNVFAPPIVSIISIH